MQETKGFLHLGIMFIGSNLNYGESFGNISTLKKYTFKGRSHSYASRLALRYDIVRIMYEELGLERMTPPGTDGEVVQFHRDANIKDYPEIDLFGYMKTSDNSPDGNTNIRKGVVRITPAKSLEPYNNDMDFGNNMGLSKRQEGLQNMLFQSEIHDTFYAYTVTVDLHKIGIETNSVYKLEPLTNEERANRINKLLLEAIRGLYRDTSRAGRADLSPVFIIGGVYTSGNPVFLNMLELNFNLKGVMINTEKLNHVLNKYVIGSEKERLKDNTVIGAVPGTFANLDSIGIMDKDNKFNKIPIETIDGFFTQIKANVKKYYGIK